MSKSKLSPRQKMINMMYIVLTALLALNVSKQVLKSFHMMEQGFMSSATKIDSKNEAIMNAFATSMKTDKNKTEPYLIRAQEARQISAEFCNYIDELKTELENLSGGREDMEEGDLVGEIRMADQMEKHANFFVNEKQGIRLQNRINKTRIKLLSLLKPSKNVELNKNYYTAAAQTAQLKAVDPKRSGTKKEDKTWIKMYLEENPIAGVLAMLTKIKNDAKTLETDVLSKLQEAVYAEDIPIDRIEALVIPKSNYVMQGTPYEAEILLVASNSTSENKILVNGAPVAVQEGKGLYKVTNHSFGTKSFSGSIMVKGKDGVEKPYNFNSEYQVYKPLATISAKKMNVVYKGLKNPIEVSVPGFAAQDILATASNGWTLRKIGPGQYIAQGSSNAREVKITASVLTEHGTKVMGSQKYRVRNVPIPKITLGTLDGSSPVSAQACRIHNRVNATLGNMFLFDGVRFQVTSFTVYVTKRGIASHRNFTGSNFAQARSMLNGLRSGDNVIITNVKARGPNGTIKPAGLALVIR